MNPKVKQSKILYSGYFDLRQDLLERFDGRTHSYTVIVASDAVVILAETPDGFWILNREYRHPAGKVVLGLPGGRIEKGEDPIVCAQRELLEETGYASDEIQVIGSCYQCPALCNQKIIYLWAKNAVKKGAQQLEPFEFIDVELMSDERLRQEIQRASDIDGNLCVALMLKNQFC